MPATDPNISDVLRDIIDRHGPTLLEDRRRCENCIRESALSKQEIAGLVAALDENLPKQMAKLPAGSLGSKGLAGFAAQLSESRGLSEAVARRSVEAWAHALRLTTAAKPAAEKPAAEKPAAEKPKAPSPIKRVSPGEAIAAGIVAAGLLALFLTQTLNLSMWQNVVIFLGFCAAAGALIRFFTQGRKKEP